MTTRKLQHMPYAQAHVNITRDGSVFLISYTTTVIHVDPSGWLTCTGLYSMPTRKHISAFLREYYPDVTFQMVKAIAGGNEILNVFTAEIQSVKCG